MALIAISSGSSVWSTQRRRIRMLVSRRPWSWVLPRIRVAVLLVGRGVLVGPEGVDGDDRGVAGHGDELVAGDEAPAPAQRDQLTDLVAVTGDRERLATLDGIHDLFGPAAKVALRDLRLGHGLHVRGW